MVAEYGMSDTVGPVAIGPSEPASFLQTPVRQPEPLAEETAREIDLEVKRLMTDAYAAALSALSSHRASLAEISRRLLEREVVDGDEIRKLLAASASEGVHAA
jgi:cell division protease FtsH